MILALLLATVPPLPPVVRAEPPVVSYTTPATRRDETLIVSMIVRGQPSTWRTLSWTLRDPRCMTEPWTPACRSQMFRAWWLLVRENSARRWGREKLVRAGVSDTMAVPIPPWSTPTLLDTMFVEVRVGVRGFGRVLWSEARGITIGAVPLQEANDGSE